MEQAYFKAGSATAAQFLLFALKQFPFPIRSIQVDGGSEFMGDFEKECRIRNIPLYVIPPRSPECNGHVERGNATVKYEFYYQYAGSKMLNNIQNDLQKWVKFYNSFRSHQGLQQATPLQYYQKFWKGLQSHIS